MVDENTTDITPQPPKGLQIEQELGLQQRQPRNLVARMSLFIRKLFSFRFDNYVIIQVVPVVYGLALIAVAVGLGYLCVEAYFHSVWRGLFYTFVAAPLTFIVLASALRALLEFYRVMFHIAEHMDSLVGIRDTVDALAGIDDSIKDIGENISELEGAVNNMSDSVGKLSDSMDEIVAATRRIPFWKNLTAGSTRGRRGNYRETDFFDD